MTMRTVFSPRGFVVRLASFEAAHVRDDGHGFHVALTIADDGCGFDPASVKGLEERIVTLLAAQNK